MGLSARPVTSPESLVDAGASPDSGPALLLRSRRAVLHGAAAFLAGGALGGCQTAPDQLVQTYGEPGPDRQRVYPAGPPAAVLLACLAPERLVGWPMPLGDAARALLPPAVRDKPVLPRLTGRGDTVDTRVLQRERPDLVLDAGTVDPAYAALGRQVHAQTGLPYLLVDGRLSGSPAQLRAMGRLLGASARGEALAAYAESALAAAAKLGEAAAQRPSVYYAHGADGLDTFAAGSINAEIIEVAGGRNVATAPPGTPHRMRVAFEQVSAWNPDWVITEEPEFHRMALADARWRELPAVRERRLLLSPTLPFGWLGEPPSINRLVGVRWLAAYLRGGQVESPPMLRRMLDEGLRFYALFYGAAPPAGTMRAWLEQHA